MKRLALYTLTLLIAGCATFSVSSDTRYGTIGATYALPTFSGGK